MACQIANHLQEKSIQFVAYILTNSWSEKWTILPPSADCLGILYRWLYSRVYDKL